MLIGANYSIILFLQCFLIRFCIKVIVDLQNELGSVYLFFPVFWKDFVICHFFLKNFVIFRMKPFHHGYSQKGFNCRIIFYSYIPSYTLIFLAPVLGKKFHLYFKRFLKVFTLSFCDILRSLGYDMIFSPSFFTLVIFAFVLFLIYHAKGLINFFVF